MSKAKAAGMEERRRGALHALERLIAIQLGNRYLWLAAGLALLAIIQLTMLQYRPKPWFETVELLAHSMMLFEAALLTIALLLGLSIPRTMEVWRQREGGRAPLALMGLAAALVIVVLALAMMIPLMLMNRYPELAKEGVRFALTVLQRGMLLCLAAMTSYNVFMILRLYFRIPGWIAAVAAVVWHLLLGYWVTYMSVARIALQRLNDVFYYSNLHDFFPSFPELSVVDERLGAVVFHNIEMPWYGYYLFSALLLWLLSYLMWLPRASTVPDDWKAGV